MKAMRWLTVAGLVILTTATAARADFINLPVKWSQALWSDQNAFYSDHTDTGVNEQVVAEDFFCSDTHPIVAVRWWGSYGYETEVREEQWVSFDIGFHLSTGEHPTSVPVTGYPVAFYQVTAQQVWVGQNEWAGGPVYRYDAYLPDDGFDQAYWAAQSPNEGELFIDICQPGGQEWAWMILQRESGADPILDWPAWSRTDFGNGGHDGPWFSIGGMGYKYELAFELMTPEPATLALVGAGLAGLLLRRRRKA